MVDREYYVSQERDAHLVMIDGVPIITEDDGTPDIGQWSAYGAVVSGVGYALIWNGIKTGNPYVGVGGGVVAAAGVAMILYDIWTTDPPKPMEQIAMARKAFDDAVRRAKEEGMGFPL